jgi:hypothetical protein
MRTTSAVTTVRLHTGDVIEIDIDGEATTALVLLATHEMVILDPCDGSMPLVARTGELGRVRVFRDNEA